MRSFRGKGWLLSLLMVIVMTFTGCADSKTFEVNDQMVVAEPYGWTNADAKKVDGVIYEVNLGNVIWSVVTFPILVIPAVWLTGWELFEPVRYEGPVSANTPPAVQ